MVVLSQSYDVVDDLTHFKTCMSNSDVFGGIPVVDLSDSGAKKVVVEACKELGFFKVINHGISMEFLGRLEDEAAAFFRSSLHEKEKSGPPSPFGYGNRDIGPNGDAGWLEYLIFSTYTHHTLISHHDYKARFPGISDSFWCLVNEYISRVRNMACKVLEMICDELKIGPKDMLSKLIRDERSDSCLRLNHYPPCLDLHALMSGRDLVGFGEHTDPQIISVVRSNNVAGLQICLRNGSWVPVPPDHTSFYFNVGDLLQVLTNGRFWSVKHRVLTNGLKSRLSMIYFGGPSLSEKIAPLSSLMEKGEECLYREFTWMEYKKSVYNSRLGDDRLELFEKSLDHDSRLN